MQLQRHCGILTPISRFLKATFEDRMKTRSELKKICRRCKIVLTVDENNEKNAADRVRRAKKDGLIDGFLYGSVSSAYLAAFIDTL